MSKIYDANESEFALLVSDHWHGLGIGTDLLKSLVKIGRNEKLERIIGHILPENRAMQRVSEKAGFSLRRDTANDECTAVIQL